MREIYDETTYEQTECLTRLMAPQPVVVGIEGGPCSGKTTLVEALIETSGRTVVVLPEVATKHILALAEKGIDFSEMMQSDRAAFLEVEALILAHIDATVAEAKRVYAGTDTIIVTDRCDISAYVTPQEHDGLLSRLELGRPPLVEHVDKLLFLPSLAVLDPDAYDRQLQTNPARYETAESARVLSDRTLAAVARHPELEVVWGTDFKETITRAMSEIMQPECEAEVKLKPRSDQAIAELFAGSDMLSQAFVRQSYHTNGSLSFRLRETVTDQQEQVYAFTVKRGDGVARYELQRHIDQKTYDLLRCCPQEGKDLVKTRFMLLSGSSDSKRLWTADRYDDPDVGWHVETNVEDDNEATRVEATMTGFERTSDSAYDLAMSTGRRTR